MAQIPQQVLDAIQSAFDAAEVTQTKVAAEVETAAAKAVATAADDHAILDVQQAQSDQATKAADAEAKLAQALAVVAASPPAPPA